MSLETKAEFARRMGWNRSTVTRAAQAGRLVMQGHLVEVEASLSRLADTAGGRTDVADRHAAARSQTNPQPKPAEKNGANGPKTAAAPKNTAGMDADPTVGDEPAHGRARYKAMVLHYENQQIKLGMAMSRGLRFARKDVARESTALGAVVRSAVERVIDQTAPRLAVMTDTARRRHLLETELRAVRRALRAEFPRALRRLRQPASQS